MASNADVINAFAIGSMDEVHAENLFVEAGVLYSYGKHWPLAVWKDGSIHINQTKRSVSSSKHVKLLTTTLSMDGTSYRMIELDEIKQMLQDMGK